MTANKRAIDLIKKYEGLRLQAYQCSANVWTIGYGHIRGVKKGDVVNIQMANKLLMNDIDDVHQQLTRVLKGVDLRQCQYDAIISLVFNIGIGNFERSNLLKIIKNDPDDKTISENWVTFRNAGGKFLKGLLKRRLEELLIYFSW